MAHVRGQRGTRSRSRSPHNLRGVSKHAFVVGPLEVGPFVLEPRGDMKVGTLRALRYEVRRHCHSPMSAEDLLVYYNRYIVASGNDRRVPRKRSWPGCLDAIGRCVAAYGNARDYDDAIKMKDKIAGYALDMQCRTVSSCTAEEFLAIVAAFIHNRWLQWTFKRALDGFFGETRGAAEHGAPSVLTTWTRDDVQRTVCLDVLTECFEHIRDELVRLKDQIIDRRRRVIVSL